MLDTHINNITNVIRNNLVTTTVARLGQSGYGAGLAKERIFNITENNGAGPDYVTDGHGCEFKATQENSSCNLTLLTAAPHVNLLVEQPPKGRKKAAMRSLTETYSVLDQDDPKRRNFYLDVKIGKDTPHGGHMFSATMNDEFFYLTCDNSPIAAWNLDRLTQRFKTKLGGVNGAGGLLHSYMASSLITQDTNEYEQVFKKSVMFEKLKIPEITAMLGDGDMILSMRAHCRDVGKPALKMRDHGSAFRISPKNLPRLYESSTDLAIHD